MYCESQLSMYFYTMIRIVVIGTGNVGFHLCRAIEDISSSDKLQLVGYYNRSQKEFPEINATLIANLDELPPADLVVLAVPDDFVPLVASEIPVTNSIIAHTSGSVAMDVLKGHKNYGVFYLPQSFSIKRSPTFKDITICLESSNDAVNEVLGVVAGTLSRKREQINSLQRKKLHLAAVYINNFVNHCYTKADEIMTDAAIPKSLLDALMKETLEKALELSPLKAQTGPAIRNDKSTIKKHLQLLSTEDREMYQTITNSIQRTHGKKL